MNDHVKRLCLAAAIILALVSVRLAAQEPDRVGFGQITVAGFRGTSLAVSSGVGHIVVTDASAESIDISLGTGEIDILLLPEA